MKFQVGDKVLILHSNEEAEVINIINNEMVTVEVDGIQFPVYTDQIDYPYFKRFTEKKQTALNQKNYIDQIPIEKFKLETKETKNVSLVFIPIFATDGLGNELIKEMKIYLANQTEQFLQFNYWVTFLGKTTFEINNTIAAFQNFYLHNIAFEDWSNNPAFHFTFSLVNPLPYKAPYFNTTIKIKPKQLFNKIQEMKLKNEPNISFVLFEHFPDKQGETRIDTHLPQLKKDTTLYDASKAKTFIETPQYIVDLHIEKLTDSWKQLNNFEILQLQLQTFEKYYDLAIMHYQPSLIIIHGVGTGRLRTEIHDILKTKKEVKSFVNQYDPRFGYGATEIIFQY